MCVCVCIVQLEVIRCVRPQEWTTSVALPSVSFAPLILPTEDETQNTIELCMYMCVCVCAQLCMCVCVCTIVYVCDLCVCKFIKADP